MEEFWIQLLAILTLLTQTFSASDTHELIGAVGGSVTFHRHRTDTGGNGALWSFENEHIVTVLFKDPSQSAFSKEKYRTRFTVSEDGRALSISQLRMEDAGTYSVTIGGKKSTFNLLVYKKLTEPTVTCKTQDCLGSICLICLSCSVPGAGFGNVSYTWRMGLRLWDEGSMVLEVNKLSWGELDLLTCTARNAISSRSVTVTIPEVLCPENSTHPPGPGALFSSPVEIWLIVGIIVLVILLVFLVLIWKCKVTTAEYLTINAKVGPFQQRIPNGINAELTGGESSRTIHTMA